MVSLTFNLHISYINEDLHYFIQTIVYKNLINNEYDIEYHNILYKQRFHINNE